MIACLVVGSGCSHETPTGLAAPRSIAEPTDDLSERFAKAVDALPVGSLVYNVPTSMTVGTSQILGVAIARTFAPSIRRELAANGPTAVTSVRIATSMKAFLVATPSAAFTITPEQRDDEEQTPDPDGRIGWSWEVLPIRAGPSQLDIEIEAGVRVRGESERFFRTVKRVEIPVIARPIQERLRDFVLANWQWLLSTLMLPFGIWAVKQRAEALKRRTPSA